jgi:hypothetical protein
MRAQVRLLASNALQLPQHAFSTNRALIGASTSNEKGISEHIAQLLQRITGIVAADVWGNAKPLLILFTESLNVRFAVRIEEFLAALLPSGFEFGRGDVPVRPAFFGNGTQVLTEIFQSGPTEEPVAVVNLINDKTGLEDNHVRDDGIVGRIGVFGDVEIFLDGSTGVGEERPVGADAGAIFIRLGDVVGADGDKPAIGDLEFVM